MARVDNLYYGIYSIGFGRRSIIKRRRPLGLPAPSSSAFSRPSSMKSKSAGWLVALTVLSWTSVSAGTKHSPSSRHPSYAGTIMCGYQGWFRAEGDGSGRGWVHYGPRKLDPDHCSVDLWPDVSEYKITYPTGFTLSDGSPARVFSSWDESTVDLHFNWMQQYGIDGVFIQRFFGVTRDAENRGQSRVILRHALAASSKYGRAIAVMYDLSGLKAQGEDCSSVIQDWKELVDDLKITGRGTNQAYLYHRGKPLVAIWGLGFSDRPYNIRNIGIEKLIDFLKHDPEYGGCSVMLGVPTHFRELSRDAVADPHLHELMASADIIMPWMVGRFSPLKAGDLDRYAERIARDIAWCSERSLDYVPCVYPGFSWHNLSHSRQRPTGNSDSNAIPRQKGRFYWSLMSRAIQAKAEMLYVAMFDEIDEGTAIFKCSNRLPVNAGPAEFVSYEGLPSDHYLWLTGQAGRLLRGEIQPDPDLYRQLERKTLKTAQQ